MATAEFAVALPAVIVLLVIALSALALGIQSIQCADAARVGAREVARGESVEVARGVAERSAPKGARVEFNQTAGWVQVRVSAPAPGPLASVGIAGAHSNATARVEGLSP